MNSSTTPSPQRGRPRAELDLRLRAAVLELLHSGGPDAVTMELVAATAGIAKTTVYRRFPDRAALLTAVLTEAIGTPTPPPDGTVPEKIRWALGEAWRQMGDILGPGGLAALVGNTNPEFTTLFRTVLAPYDDALAALIQADADAGLLRPDVDADTAVSLFLGAYLGELVRRGTVAEGWIDQCLDMMWAAMSPVRS